MPHINTHVSCLTVQVLSLTSAVIIVLVLLFLVYFISFYCSTGSKVPFSQTGSSPQREMHDFSDVVALVGYGSSTPDMGVGVGERVGEGEDLFRDL